MKKITLTLAATCMLVGFGLQAQESFRSWSFGFQAAHLYDFPSTRFDTRFNSDPRGLNGDKTSFDLGASLYVEKMFTPLLGLQFAGSFGSMSGANTVEYYTNSYYQFQLDGVFYLSNLDPRQQLSRWNYYLKTGFGYGAFEAEQFLIADDSPDNRASDNFWSSRLGGGLQYELNSRWRLEFEVSYNWIKNDGFDGYNNASGSDNFLQTAIGVAYSFGPASKRPLYSVNYFNPAYLTLEKATENSKRDSAVQAELIALKAEVAAQKNELEALNKQTEQQRATIATIESTQDQTLGTNKRGGLNPRNSISTEVFFGFDSAVLDRESKRSLAMSFSSVEDKATAKLMLTGYADKSGDPVYNTQLRERRMAAVQAFLLELGFTAENITLELGEATDVSRDNQFLNRKVKIELH